MSSETFPIINGIFQGVVAASLLALPVAARELHVGTTGDDTHTLAPPDGTLVLKLHHTAEAGLTYALEADGRLLIDFLGERAFEALVIQDGPDSDYRTHVESLHRRTPQGHPSRPRPA